MSHFEILVILRDEVFKVGGELWEASENDLINLSTYL